MCLSTLQGLALVIAGHLLLQIEAETSQATRAVLREHPKGGALRPNHAGMSRIQA